MKKRIFLVALFMLFILTYFAWQPLLPRPFAWNNLPDITIKKKSIKNKDNIWVSPINHTQELLVDWQKKLNAPSLSVAIGHQNEVLLLKIAKITNYVRYYPTDFLYKSNCLCINLFIA